MISRIEADVVEVAAATPPGPTYVRFAVLLLIAFASSSAYLTRHCIAVANTTIQKELGFNNADMGLVMGAFSAGYLICQVPGGWLGNLIGVRAALSLLSELWSGFTVWTSAVASLVPMTTSRFAFGLAQAGLVPNSAKVVKDWFSLRRRGIVSAIIGVSMSIGGAFTMRYTGRLMEFYDWREVFRMYSLVGIVWAIVFFLFFRNRPAEHPWVNRAELQLISDEPAKSADESAQTTEGANGPSESEASVPFGVMVRSRTLWALCVQSFFRAAAYYFFVTFFPAFLEFAYGTTREQSATLATWPLVGVIGGGLFAGLLVDFLLRRTGSKWISRTGVAATALGLTGMLILASTLTTTSEQLVVVISIGAMFSGMASPSAWSATIDVAGRHTAVVVGIMNMAGCVSGVVVTPLLGRLMDFIKETDGNWNLVIYLHAGFYLAAAISWLAVNPNTLVTEPGDEDHPD